MVNKGDLLGVLSDPYGDNRVKVIAQKTGIVIGMTRIPLVNNGDALFHIAIFEDSEAVGESIETHDDAYQMGSIA